MASLDLGEGLWNYVIANGDFPICDSVYTHNKNGSQVEEVKGTKGTYRATNATGVDGAPGDWKVYGPFGE